MVGETKVVLGVDDAGLQDELLHFLDRLAGVTVIGAAESEHPLRLMIREREPDAVVGVPNLLGADLPPALAVAVRETTKDLRKAIRAGARGFYVWPDEREALGRDVVGVSRVRPESGEKGLALAVFGARGGAGATFLATNLAGALARRNSKTVLADLDPAFGDVTPALGIPADAPHPSVADLLGVTRELTTEHLDRVLHSHPMGFEVLLAPQQVPSSLELDQATVAAVVAALQERFSFTVLHLPRVLDGTIRSVAGLVDELFIVVTLDVLGIRSAKRVVDFLRSFGLGDSLRLLVNRASRGEVVPEDAELVLGVPIACVIPSDRSVERALNRGELVVTKRGRVSRRINALAARLEKERAA